MEDNLVLHQWLLSSILQPLRAVGHSQCYLVELGSSSVAIIFSVVESLTVNAIHRVLLRIQRSRERIKTEQLVRFREIEMSLL